MCVAGKTELWVCFVCLVIVIVLLFSFFKEDMMEENVQRKKKTCSSVSTGGVSFKARHEIRHAMRGFLGK